MVELLQRLFGIIGLDIAPPETFAELIPYFLTVVVAICLVGSVFALFRSIGAAIVSKGRRWY